MEVFTLFFEDVGHALLDTNSIFAREYIEVLVEGWLDDVFSTLALMVLFEAKIVAELEVILFHQLIIQIIIFLVDWNKIHWTWWLVKNTSIQCIWSILCFILFLILNLLLHLWLPDDDGYTSDADEGAEDKSK